MQEEYETELLRPIRALRGSALLLYDLHLFFVHTTAMHLELGQSAVDLFHIFCGQYKFGGFDVLLKVLDFARSGDRDDERLLGQEPCERELRCCCVLPCCKLRDAIDKGLVGSNACRLEAVESRTKIRFRCRTRLS